MLSIGAPNCDEEINIDIRFACHCMSIESLNELKRHDQQRSAHRSWGINTKVMSGYSENCFLSDWQWHRTQSEFDHYHDVPWRGWEDSTQHWGMIVVLTVSAIKLMKQLLFWTGVRIHCGPKSISTVSSLCTMLLPMKRRYDQQLLKKKSFCVHGWRLIINLRLQNQSFKNGLRQLHSPVLLANGRSSMKIGALSEIISLSCSTTSAVYECISKILSATFLPPIQTSGHSLDCTSMMMSTINSHRTSSLATPSTINMVPIASVVSV